MTGALEGQTVVVIGGSAGTGLETARLARAEGAEEIVLAGRNPERLERAGSEVGARSTSAFDAGDPEALSRFFAGLEAAVDHVMVTAGRPHYGRLADMSADEVRAGVSEHMAQSLEVARHMPEHVSPGGSLVLMVGPKDVAALAVHTMINTALTGATYDIDGG